LSSGGLTTRPPARLVCRRTEALAVHVPLGVAPESLGAAWVEYRLRVFGFDRDGRRIDLSRNRGRSRLYFPRQELRHYVLPPVDLYGIRLYVELPSPGRYELGPPRIERHGPFAVGPGG
jgi:hypothetical protein